jgi:hypothetical protein
MLNILSLNCSLAFAPYLIESATAFLEGEKISRVVRQGGSGLIVRSEERLLVRHQNREGELTREDLLHYVETIGFRTRCFDVTKQEDEIVLANVGADLLLSHPQSEMWLDYRAISRLLYLAGVKVAGHEPGELPEWLTCSTGGDRLLLSDQRNGRWVLLGSDHVAELERRLSAITGRPHPQVKPPVISMKGLTIHLQFAKRLSDALRRFAETGEAPGYEEVTPRFRLRVARSPSGIEIEDSNGKTAVTAKEARKWAAIIDDELARLNVLESERGSIKTVFANDAAGRWVLQWGDEVFVPDETLDLARQDPRLDLCYSDDSCVAAAASNEFLTLLGKSDAGCVALTRDEVDLLIAQK